MSKQYKKWSENKELRAFKDFYITKITTIEQPEGIVDDDFRKRYGNPCDIEITLESSKDKSKFIYSSPNPERLDEYGLSLYNFIYNRPRKQYWAESRKVYNGNDFVERDIKYHD